MRLEVAVVQRALVRRDHHRERLTQKLLGRPLQHPRQRRVAVPAGEGNASPNNAARRADASAQACTRLPGETHGRRAEPDRDKTRKAGEPHTMVFFSLTITAPSGSLDMTCRNSDTESVEWLLLDSFDSCLVLILKHNRQSGKQRSQRVPWCATAANTHDCNGSSVKNLRGDTWAGAMGAAEQQPPIGTGPARVRRPKFDELGSVLAW